MSKDHHDKRPYRQMHFDRRHWTKTGKGTWKVKISFNTIEDAYDYLAHHKNLVNLGKRPYLCPICGNIHIGTQRNEER